MRRLAGLTLAAFLISGSLVAATDPAPLSAPSVDYVGTYVWSMDDETFGGFSGIEISDDGSRFTVLSDRSELRWGRVERDAGGAIDRLEASGKAHLFDSTGKWLQPGWKGDSEGLAIDAAGTIWVSFEGLSRVVRYDTPESLAKPLPRPPEFKSMQRNSSFEALAVMADGTLLTLPERSGQLTRPFPVWRWRNGTWDQPFSIRAAATGWRWAPISARTGGFTCLSATSRAFWAFAAASAALKSAKAGFPMRPCCWKPIRCNMTIWKASRSGRMRRASA